MEGHFLGQEYDSKLLVLPNCVISKSLYCLHPTTRCSFYSPSQFHGALSTHRLLGDGLLEIEGQNLLRLREAAAWVLPQWVGLCLPALSKIQGVLEEMRIDL